MMNIAIIGPEKYDFQDLVAGELGMRWQHFKNVSLIGEVTSGEDAQITWQSDDLSTPY